MINVPAGYTDAHGLEYQTAIVVINQAGLTNHQSTQVSMQVGTNGVISYNTQESGAGRAINFTAVLYPSEADLQAGRPPIQFRPANHSEYFNFSAPAEVQSSGIVAACEAWLVENVFTN
jgi:hypothetical protein